MIQAADDSTAQLRWGVYALLIALAVGNMSGRLLAVNAVNRADLERHLIKQDLKKTETKLRSRNLSEEEFQNKLAEAKVRIESDRRMQRPFLSANDRSRWMAIRALAELGAYEIDSLIDQNLWNTIDMVQHRGRDGELHLYSSKPPLLITLLAGEYWVVNKLTGLSLESHPYAVGRFMLFTVNVLPMALMFFLIAKLAERLGSTNWGRVFTVAAGAFGTMLLPFSIVLNNHTVAAVSAALALYAAVRIWFDGETRLRYYLYAGFGAAFAAANELPALALLVLLAVALWTCNPRAWLLGYLPAAGLVVVAFFATNYAAHDCLTPPYMHKSSDDPEENWYDYTYTAAGKTRESYWNNRQGIDQGEPSKSTYALHVLLGHHGIFSLTPVWILSVLGILIWSFGSDPSRRQLALAVAALSLVCLIFYIGLRPQEDRNYGGMTSGFRWMFWFVPLWLTVMLPAADWTARTRLGKSFALTLLVFSALSAAYPAWNPWIQPWIYNWMQYCGWQGF